jgi:transcriptional regulator with XRE-family HTH domain
MRRFSVSARVTGAELRVARKAQGLTQAALAARVGVSRDTVQYWEKKPFLKRRGAAGRLAEALGFAVLPRNNARAGGWGVSVEREFVILYAAHLARAKEREAQRLARLRVICGAKTRKGTPCRCKSEPGKRRCKFHGGKSTGPKTQAGRDRIAEAQRRRWARVKALSLSDGGH